jgi:hypothetical protein
VKKTLMVLAVMATLWLGVATGASAFVLGDNYNAGPGIVSFYLIDGVPGNFDNQVIMTATTLGFPLGAPIGDFQYSLDNTTWSSFTGTGAYSGTATIPIPATHTQLIYLKYGSDQTAESLVFTSWSVNTGTNTMPNNLDLFTGLMVNFNNSANAITFVSNAGNDKIAPVPIPNALWLFAPALAGLVGLRRRFMK